MVNSKSPPPGEIFGSARKSSMVPVSGVNGKAHPRKAGTIFFVSCGRHGTKLHRERLSAGSIPRTSRMTSSTLAGGGGGKTGGTALSIAGSVKRAAC